MPESPLNARQADHQTDLEDAASRSALLVQNIIDANPNGFTIQLTDDDVQNLYPDIMSTQSALTNISDNTPDFANELGYSGYKKHIFNSILTDALLAYNYNGELFYSRDKSNYSKVGHLGYDTVIRTIKHLSDNGLIRDFRAPKPDFKKPQHGKARIQSFIKPTAELHQRFGDRLADWEPSQKPLDWAIELTTRGEIDCPIYMTFKPKTRTKAKGAEFSIFNRDLVEKNQFLAGFDIDFRPKRRNKIFREKSIVRFIASKQNKNGEYPIRTINISNIYQKRIFLKEQKDDTKFYGGRFYGGFWQRLSEGDRSRIYIDGEKVAKEKDYKAIHPTLAYCLAGVDMPKEVYQGDCKISKDFGDSDRWRKICKIALLIAINAKSFNAAKGALAISLINMYGEKYPKFEDDIEERKRRIPARRDAKRILKAVIKFNDPIKDYIHSDYGIKFQRIDSDIMANVQRRCRETNIPILGVHDSILFPTTQHKQAKSIFFEELETAKQSLRNRGLAGFGM